MSSGDLGAGTRLGTNLLSLACPACTWRLSNRGTHPADLLESSNATHASMSSLSNQLAQQSKN